MATSLVQRARRLGQLSPVSIPLISSTGEFFTRVRQCATEQRKSTDED